MNGTLLIVEDEENDVFFLKDALKKAGIVTPIQVVEDGRRHLAGTCSSVEPDMTLARLKRAMRTHVLPDLG